MLGCSVFSHSILWDYLDLLQPYLGGIAIVGGCFLCFLGLKLVKPSICVAGFLTCTLASCLIFYAVYLNSIDDVTTFFYFLGAGAAIGIFVGLLLAYFSRFGAACLAGWGGFALGLLINETLLARFGLTWLLWTSIVICIIVCAVLAFIVYEHAIILCTALLGGFFAIRGVAVYGGSYYNVFTVSDMVEAGLIDQIDPIYWAYMAAMVVMFGLGAVVQYKCRPKKKDDKS